MGERDREVNAYQVGFVVWVDVVAPDRDTAIDRAADSLREQEAAYYLVDNLSVLNVKDRGNVGD